MSMITRGRISLSFSIGRRDCPPAMRRASSPYSRSSASASGIESGARYSKGGGIIRKGARYPRERASFHSSPRTVS